MSVKVLVVEDQDDIRVTLVDLLTEAGYEVRCAGDPQQAVELLERLPRPCILLWDPMIPRVSLTMVEKAILEGVHVATIPVSVTPRKRAGGQSARQKHRSRTDETPREMNKKLASSQAVLRIVEEQCPLEHAANG
jgi:CheY-like chemotaxis protein